MIALAWEALHDDGDSGLVTERARVLGGWLVRSRALDNAAATGAAAMAFVPDTHGAWDDPQE